jgi:hypothetical protein
MVLGASARLPDVDADAAVAAARVGRSPTAVGGAAAGILVVSGDPVCVGAVACHSPVAGIVGGVR